MSSIPIPISKETRKRILKKEDVILISSFFLSPRIITKFLNMNESSKTFFAPQLLIRSGVSDISFYEKAFGAVELRRFTNDDGSIHVAELSIDGALFHLHEESERASQFNPDRVKGTTVIVGLFVHNVDAVMNEAVQAGASIMSPTQSYDYGYRQGRVKDPFGHMWMIEQRI
jgi:PhnB protein